MKPLKCRVCGHEWFPNSARLPRRCPNHACRSMLWRTGERRRRAKKKAGQRWRRSQNLTGPDGGS